MIFSIFFFIHSIFSQAEINSKNNSSTTGVGEHALYVCNKSSALKHSFFVHCDVLLYIINVWFPIPLITTTKKIQNCSERYFTCFRYQKIYMKEWKRRPPPKKKAPHVENRISWTSLKWMMYISRWDRRWPLTNSTCVHWQGSCIRIRYTTFVTKYCAVVKKKKKNDYKI